MTTQLTVLTPLSERPLHERVAATIRAEMARFGVTQAQIASALKVSQQSVSSKRNGRTPFTLDELEVIAPMLGMSPAELVLGQRRAGGDGWAPWGSNPQPAD